MKIFVFLIVFLKIFGGVISCKTSEECPESGSCVNDICVCDKGFVLSEDQSKCLPYVTEYFGDCSESSQCEWLGPNSVCNYVCTCDKGYRWFLGKCVKFVGLEGSCLVDSDCFDGYNLNSLICENGTCSCSSDYYKRDGVDCRKKAESVDDICALNIDCKSPATLCVLGKCKNVAPKSMETIDSIFPKLHHQIQDEHTCSSNNDCKDSNTECFDQTGTCTCQKGYFLSTGGCIPELGMKSNCKNDHDCLIKPGKCIDGACYCRDYYFVSNGNRECIKTISENNWNCIAKEWCYAWGSSVYCSSNNTCSCTENSDKDDTNNVCVVRTEPDPNSCNEDFQCKYIKNGYCVDEKCGCKKHYVLNDNVCIAGIDAPCTTADDCNSTLGLDCLAERCQCIEHYVPFDLKCYKESSLNKSCDVDVQCSSPVDYSHCDNSVCKCDDDRWPDDGLCIPKKDFNSYCDNKRQCTLSLSEKISSIMCRNHKCQCPTGLTLIDGVCSSGSFTIGNLFLITSLLLKHVFSFF